MNNPRDMHHCRLKNSRRNHVVFLLKKLCTLLGTGRENPILDQCRKNILPCQKKGVPLHFNFYTLIL